MSIGIFSEEFFETFYALHEMGMPFAKTFVVYGAGFSIGKNLIKLFRGTIRGGVAISDFIRDVILAFIGGYFIGGVGIGAKIFYAMGGEVSDDWTTMLFNVLNAFGVNLDALPSLVSTTSALLVSAVIGAFIGAIFGFLFG